MLNLKDLGDLLCFICVSLYCVLYVYFVFFRSVLLQYFDTVGWVF